MKHFTASDVDTQLAQLKSEHARLEDRLRELDRHLSLSPDEQTERLQIKKTKLQLKDDMLHLSQQRLRA
jgi:uncharacterized protein YdcH (DUF465 family)